MWLARDCKSQQHLTAIDPSAIDLAVAQAYAELMVKARTEGQTIPVSGGYIAATSAANSMMVARRDTARFEAAGLKTVDLWTA